MKTAILLLMFVGRLEAQVAWSLPPTPGGPTLFNGWNRLQYDPLTKTVLGYIHQDSSSGTSTIYSSALYKWNSTTGSFGSPIQGWNQNDCPASITGNPGPRHPYATPSMLNSRLWIWMGVCAGVSRNDMWYFDSNVSTNPTQVWARVTPAHLPYSGSGADYQGQIGVAD